MFAKKIFRFYTVNLTYASARYENGSPLILRGFEAKCAEHERDSSERERESLRECEGKTHIWRDDRKDL